MGASIMLQARYLTAGDRYRLHDGGRTFVVTSTEKAGKASTRIFFVPEPGEPSDSCHALLLRERVAVWR